MKISLFVNNLSGNPIVRAYPIAKALERLGHEVEVLGFTINSNDIYEPYKDAFLYKTERIRLDIKQVIIRTFSLSGKANGEIIYAFKPLWTTLFPALLASGFGMRKRIILDIEDNEFWDTGMHSGFRMFRKNWRNPLNPLYTKLLHPFTWLVKRKTVVSSSLQRRYGGTIVLHGPLNRSFDFDGDPNLMVASRKSLKLPEDKRLLVFAGKPTNYKGIDFLVDTLLEKPLFNWHLVLAGDEKNESFLEAKSKLKNRCHLLGFLPHDKMQELYLAVDAVPVLQKENPVTTMQIPAKLLEAMSYGKAVVSTYVSDIPAILQSDTKNGWLVPFGNKEALIGCLHEIESEELKEHKVGRNAISFYKKNATVDEIANRIEPFLK